MITYREYCRTIREDWGKTSPIPKETYKPTDWKDNFHWIDLGLPSGTLWADVNLYNPDDKNGFWTYDEIMASPYKDYVPTKEQMNELHDNCKWGWSEGGNGLQVHSKYNGRDVFFPAEGSYRGRVVAPEFDGYYLTSTPYNNDYVYVMSFGGKYIIASTFSYVRAYGYSVRLVRPK